MSTVERDSDIAVVLREPVNRVSPRTITWWAWRAVPGWAAPVLGQAAALLWFTTGWQVAGLALTLAAATAHIMIMPRLRYRVHRWELATEALYTRSGWLTIHWTVTPVSRVQTVTTHRGPLQRRLGLTTLTVTTASAKGPLDIAGFAHADAVALADTLTRLSHESHRDAT